MAMRYVVRWCGDYFIETFKSDQDHAPSHIYAAGSIH